MMRRPSPFPLSPSHPGGFTLVEMTVVIVLTGILAGIVALFIRAPVQGYVDSARRAGLTDIADTALRRISRDLRLALPNSVVVTSSGTQFSLDFLSTSGGGRYRASAGGTNDVLDFTVADISFEVLGAMPMLAANDQIVVYNLGTPGADAYLNNNRATYSSHAGGIITFAAGKQFPFASPSQRFHVVNGQVRYLCDTATGQLTRYWGFAIAAPPAVPTVPAGGSSALLATRVSACGFAYNANVVTQRSGLVTLQLTLSESGESVALYNAVHVSNAP
ncbi:MAG: prepilin-type N-terminal cleavage/methylation domain-containing protein [Nitrosomonadales bacterium]|nr:prepilin-type N-terminal cleavage/methylation domain-containing protein [Nitrosomonadales bacterium]